MTIIGASRVSSVCLLYTDCVNAPKEEKKVPDIIFILSDELCWRKLGCYGQQKIKTPNIARLQKQAGYKSHERGCFPDNTEHNKKENHLRPSPSVNDNSHVNDKRYLELKSGPTLEEFYNNTSPTRGTKGESYDVAFHVPAMVGWPGLIQACRVSDQVSKLWDFLPPAAEITGSALPAIQPVDGISFLPQLKGEKLDIKRLIFFHFPFYQGDCDVVLPFKKGRGIIGG